jgi:hypothetical protein
MVNLSPSQLQPASLSERHESVTISIREEWSSSFLYRLLSFTVYCSSYLPSSPQDELLGLLHC